MSKTSDMLIKTLVTGMVIGFLSRMLRMNTSTTLLRVSFSPKVSNRKILEISWPIFSKDALKYSLDNS